MTFNDVFKSKGTISSLFLDNEGSAFKTEYSL